MSAAISKLRCMGFSFSETVPCYRRHRGGQVSRNRFSAMSLPHSPAARFRGGKILKVGHGMSLP
jgi:hypothetical protein